MRARLVTFVGLLLPSIALSQTHCIKGEMNYFSCTTSLQGKVLSICGNIGNEGISNDSWVQYRFGKIGHVELSYPESKIDSVKKFQGIYFVKYDTVTLSFINGNALYDVNLWYSHEVEGEKIPQYGGVTATLSESRHVEIPCQKVAPHRYFNNFMHLANMLSEHNGSTDFQSMFFNGRPK